MNILNFIEQKLKKLNVECEIKGDGHLYIKYEDVINKFQLDAEWEESYQKITKARSSSFSNNDWSHQLNNSIEIPLVRIDQDIYRENEEIIFKDKRDNKISITRCSYEYSIAHFQSDHYEDYFKKFIIERLKRTTINLRGRNLSILFRRPISACFTLKGRKTPENLKEIAISKIKSCLFKLAVEREICYEIAIPQEARTLLTLISPKESDWIAPDVIYDENLVNYYKVARSSPFPSQSYLAYYHILEYYFLRVSEDHIHHQIKTIINSISFKTDTESIDRIISQVRKHSTNDDETEMLRKVISRFLDESSLIDEIKRIETECGNQIYTKKRVIFGEQIEISTREGHAISNLSKALKHIRNALVHSSDKYKRDECHIPLTATEHTIEEYIPIIKYLAEQIIYGTAIPNSK